MPKFVEPLLPVIKPVAISGPGGMPAISHFSVIDPTTGIEVQRTATFADALVARAALYAAAQARGY